MMKQSLACEILISSSSAAATATASSSHTHTHARTRKHTCTHMHTCTHFNTVHTVHIYRFRSSMEKKQIDAWPARPVYTVFFDTGQNWTQQNRREQKENSVAVEENNRE